MAVNYVGDSIESKSGSIVSHKKTPRFTVDQVRSFKSILRFLNEKDRDILYLIFVAGKKQKDVQQIIGRSQPSLCYDIKRIRLRLRFIFYLQSVFDIYVDFISKRSLSEFTETEREILTLMFYTSSFTTSASILGMSQVRVRYAYDKCLRKMERLRWWDAYEIFVVIRSNLNIIKRAYRDDESGQMFVPS